MKNKPNLGQVLCFCSWFQLKNSSLSKDPLNISTNILPLDFLSIIHPTTWNKNIRPAWNNMTTCRASTLWTIFYFTRTIAKTFLSLQDLFSVCVFFRLFHCFQYFLFRKMLVLKMQRMCGVVWRIGGCGYSDGGGHNFSVGLKNVVFRE